MGARLRRHLFNGLLIAAPLWLSFSVLAWLATQLDNAAAPLVSSVFGRHVAGLGLLAALLLLVAVGALASNLVGQYLLELIEGVLLRIPGFNWLYGTMKQLTDLFSPDGKVRFQRVVLVEYPSPGLWAVGFVTREVTLEEAEGGSPPKGSPSGHLCVYVPSNHMHFGQTVVVPAAKVRPTPLGLQQGVQSVLSAGASLPDTL